MAKSYCESCNEYRRYTIKEEFRKYNMLIAYCDECGSEMFISELRDENLKRLRRSKCTI